MKEIKKTIPEEYLEEIANSPTRRHARVFAGWLNNSHGQTRENRVAIQKAAMSRKKGKFTDNSDGGDNENRI